MVETLLIRGARLLDPSDGTDREGDLLMVDGRIVRVGNTVRDGDMPQGCRVVSGDGLIACPGLI
ncbi:MAG: dihydroorotase, partial [Chloroflexi bacterium]|nr:dihydroorotase [Chloroflexota bacterium]